MNSNDLHELLFLEVATLTVTISMVERRQVIVGEYKDLKTDETLENWQ